MFRQCSAVNFTTDYYASYSGLIKIKYPTPHICGAHTQLPLCLQGVNQKISHKKYLHPIGMNGGVCASLHRCYRINLGDELFINTRNHYDDNNTIIVSITIILIDSKLIAKSSAG